MSDNGVTLESIEAKVADEKYEVRPDGRTTVCTITPINGWTEEGRSACVDAANFNEELGRKYSREDAIRKLWPLEGYLLKEKLHRNSSLPVWCRDDARPLLHDCANGDVAVIDANDSEVMLVVTARKGSGATARKFLDALAREML